jgi:hypothetical protein
LAAVDGRVGRPIMYGIVMAFSVFLVAMIPIVVVITME